MRRTPADPRPAPARARSLGEFGSGIKEELLPVIFDRFRQGSAHKGGLGLGLSISKEIVSLHGGRIVATSPRDRGAEFTVVLPRPVSASAA